MKYWSIIIAVWIYLPIKAQQDAGGKLLDAEYIFWQAKSDTVRFKALLDKARLCRHAAMYNRALDELERAALYSHKPGQQAQLKYEKMMTYFLAGRYIDCSTIEMSRGEADTLYNNYLAMKLYSFDESEQWDSCKNLLLKLCPAIDTDRINEIKKLPVSYRYKDPGKANRLSSVLPGLGMIYAGYPFRGITSFVLTAGSVVFGVYNIYYGYYVTSVVFGAYPYLRFHTGGRRLSEVLAYRHNYIEAGKLKKKYREEISPVVH